MTTMNIDQANKTFNELTQNLKRGKIEKDKMDKFLIEFIELLNTENFSQANTDLFSSFVGLYLKSNKTPTLFKDILHLVNIYIDIMKNPSVYENRGAIII